MSGAVVSFALRVWNLYGDYILSSAAGIAIALAVMQALLRVFKEYKPRHMKKDEGLLGKEKKEYYPVLIGAVLGFFAFAQSLQTLHIAFAAAFVGGLIGRLSVVAYGWLKNKVTEERKAGEVVMLGEIIHLYAASGYTLYESLSASVYVVNLIREPIQKCLRTWAQGPNRAVKRMQEEINLPEANILCGILQRAVNIGAGNVSELLGQESYVMDRIRQYRIEQGLTTRPIIQAAYLIFPGFALLGVTLIPVGYHVSKMILGIHL